MADAVAWSVPGLERITFEAGKMGGVPACAACG